MAEAVQVLEIDGFTKHQLLERAEQIIAEVGRHGHPEPHHTAELKQINRLLGDRD